MFSGFLLGVAVLALIWLIVSIVTQEAKLVMDGNVLNDGQPCYRYAPGAVVLNVFGRWLQIGRLRSYDYNGQNSLPFVGHTESE